MDSLRRVGGQMEPYRGIAGHRSLLPAEVEMCEILGITEGDYWVFCELAQRKSEEQHKAYELVPDIRNEPVTIISLVVGLALTAVSALLTPKPKSAQERKAPPQLQTADATGPKRFATQAGFNTVQSVASLGQIIPLVYCLRVGNQGGVRVASTLLWSRLTSWTTTQQFEGIYLFSSGPLWERPDYYGYAIGDTLISSYPEDKFRLIFAPDGGRPTVNVQFDPTLKGQYPETRSTDTRIPGNGFEVFRPNSANPSPDFCGVRTPSSQTQFGLYAPMPNGMAFQLPYELVLVQDGTGNDQKNRSREKKEKLSKRFPIGAAVTAGTNFQLKGSIITYTLRPDLYTSSASWADDWGVEDIQQTQRARLEEIDANIGVGSQYLIGQTLVVCSSISPPEPWREGLQKTYQFKTVERNPGANVDIKGVGGTEEVFQNTAVCRAAVGTVSNSRPCNATEIGIRSQVWKQLSFTNVNSQPSRGTIEDYEQQGGSINLGQTNKYINRFSFFSLQARIRGNEEWTNLTGQNNIFCIKGNTPQDQYNYINISHPLGEYEFRFLPIPGNNIWKFWRNTNNFIWQLRHGEAQGPLRTTIPGVSGNFEVYFQGVRVSPPLNVARFSNKEWIIGPDLDDWGESLNPFDAIADYIKYDGETASHQSAPEHEIVYVNEIIYNNGTPYDDFIGLNPGGPQYDNLAIAGLNLWSDKEWSSLSEFSAWCNVGISIKKPNGFTGPTNLLPEIVYDLLTNESHGAGKLVGVDQVDTAAMANAAQYCAANNFTWNGVVTDRLNLREWIFENAGYCLLDFTIIGGQFALKPTPIINVDGTIDRDGPPTIKALFTDGIINNLQVTFLGPEDRQAFKAICLYREDDVNGFPETKAIKVQLANSSPAFYTEEAGNHDNDPEETFDFTGFMTVPIGARPDHAVTFAKTAIRTRTLVTHSIQFETTPEAASGLAPGDYFRLSSTVSHTSRFNNGVVSAEGFLSSTTPLEPGAYDIYAWRPDTEAVQEATLRIDENGKASPVGIVFTQATRSIETRIYKVESISYAETGLVEIVGSVTPISNQGGLAIMDDRGFIVEQV
jgi:hypothetical protein